MHVYYTYHTGCTSITPITQDARIAISCREPLLRTLGVEGDKEQITDRGGGREARREWTVGKEFILISYLVIVGWSKGAPSWGSLRDPLRPNVFADAIH